MKKQNENFEKTLNDNIKKFDNFRENLSFLTKKELYAIIIKICEFEIQSGKSFIEFQGLKLIINDKYIKN